MDISKVIRKLDAEIKWMRSELYDLEKLVKNYKLKGCLPKGVIPSREKSWFNERHHYCRGKRDMMKWRLDTLVKMRDEIKEEAGIAL
jgi:hypothetical protein